MTFCNGSPDLDSVVTNRLPDRQQWFRFFEHYGGVITPTESVSKSRQGISDQHLRVTV